MGPLDGLKVVEFAGIGPGPFCAMMLSDMGAEVVRIDKKPTAGASSEPGLFNQGKYGITNRGRKSVGLDLKKPEAIEAALRLIENADVLIEGYRPGVMERLGLGPDVCHERNPRLVYGRMTGWGQTGPLSAAAGHDINYIALTGALHAIGRKGERPAVPLNLVGDFGGGAMMLAFGVVCATLHARTSGKGQVVDAAMTDGASTLMAMIYGLKGMGFWDSEREANLLDGAAHFYDTYECADGEAIAVGPIEPQFYKLLLEKCGIDDPALFSQIDPTRWPQQKEKLAAVFITKTRGQWCELLEGTDACVAPVLSMDEAPHHPHNKARGTFIEIDGVTQPAPAPRFSRTAPEIQGPPPAAGEHSKAVLSDWGFEAGEIETLSELGVI